MKLLVTALILVLSTSAFATTYAYKHQIGMLAGYDEASCKAEGNQWSEDEFCVIDTADTVSIDKVGQKYKVAVDTITTNAHMCSYEADNGELVGKNKIVSSVPTTKYDSETGKATPAECAVTVTFNKDKSASVSTNGREECAEMCGHNASLEIEKAVAQ